MVFKWKDSAPVSYYDRYVFHYANYIHDVWGRFFEIIDIIPEHSEYQDVVILRKLEGS